jgi:3'-phosphoadenosine 5'-phosphosulfate sulfotransferase (PAPS reductase)/FAD synthetase
MKDKEEYLLHAKLDTFQRRVHSTRDFMADCEAKYGPLALSVSWGKDSLVMAHLAKDLSLPHVWLYAGEFDDWPDTERVAREFCERWPTVTHKVECTSVVKCYRSTGGFYVFAESPGQKKADRLYSDSFVETITKAIKDVGCRGSFIGLRAEESRGRLRLLRFRGQSLYSKTHQLWECFPLAWWTGRDIWAYIFSNDIPYSRMYDLYPDRERARNGAMFAATVPNVGGVDTYFGQFALIKRHYPELFNRFAAEFPEVRCYV